MKSNCINNAAARLFEMGDVRGALNLFQEGLHLLGTSTVTSLFSEAQSGPHHEEEGWMLMFCEPLQVPLQVEDESIIKTCIFFNLAVTSIHLHRNVEAVKFFNTALVAAKQTPSSSGVHMPFSGPSQDVILGHIQFRLGCDFYSKGQFEEALERFEKAFEIRKHLHSDNSDGAHDLDIASAIFAAANCNQKIGNDLTALYLFMDFIETVTLRLGEDHFYVGASLVHVGNIHVNRTDLRSALLSYRKAFHSLKQSVSAEHTEVIKVLKKIGVTSFELRDYDTALEAFTEKLSVEIGMRPANKPDIILTQIEIAHMYQLKEDFENACQFFQEALVLQYSIGDDDLKIASTLHSIGCIQCERGEFEHALAFYKEALRLRESKLGQVHFDVSTTLNSIGTVHFRSGQNILALKNYQSSLKIHRSIQSSPRDIAAVLTNIASVHSNMGDDDAALAIRMEVLDLERSSNESSHCIHGLGFMFSASVVDGNLKSAPAA